MRISERMMEMDLQRVEVWLRIRERMMGLEKRMLSGCLRSPQPVKRRVPRR